LTSTVIIAVPRIEPHRPPPGPAIIAGVCATLGHEVQVIDLNIEFFHFCKTNQIDYYEFDGVWDRITDPKDHLRDLLDQFIDHWCSKIQGCNFDNILISVFGISGTVFADLFLQRLRPGVRSRIIAGGMGIASINLLDSEKCFGQSLLQKGLIDMYITGEGEKKLVDALHGNIGAGINNNIPHQVEDLDELPTPDYGYFDLEKYDYLTAGQKEVYITGSRGCVRRCTYCDIERYWPKYRYRSGQNITDEIIRNYEKFGITKFYFTDSLVNGSLKAFSDMCESLARYKFETPISWSGQFIFRDRKSVPKDHFATIKAAGGDQFYVGIETGSDRVRFDMGKKFTNEDIDFQLQECSRNGIKIMPLMFTGYITETIQDHKDNLDCFRRWQRYVADGTIIGVELGSDLVILPGAPVERMIESHGIKFMLDHNNEPALRLWEAESNPSLTVRERIRRKIEVHETAMKYAWPVWRQHSRLKDLKNLILRNNLHLNHASDFHQLVRDARPGRRVIMMSNATQ
jgi:hypothetical protein